MNQKEKDMEQSQKPTTSQGHEDVQDKRTDNEYTVVAMCEAPSQDKLSLNAYQQKALETALYPNDHEIPYLALALCGEAGEVADKVKKVLRDKGGTFYQPDIHAIVLEIGDVLWYAANLANVLGFKLSDVAQLNIYKINSRLERGTLHGSGDER